MIVIDEKYKPVEIKTVAQAECVLIRRALAQGTMIKDIGAQIGISERSVYRKMRQYERRDPFKTARPPP